MIATSSPIDFVTFLSNSDGAEGTQCGRQYEDDSHPRADECQGRVYPPGREEPQANWSKLDSS